MKLEDLKVSDLHRIIEKKIDFANSKRTIEVEEICKDYIALNYTDSTGNVMDTDYFDILESREEESRSYVLNYLFEAVEYLKILINAIEPQTI